MSSRSLGSNCKMDLILLISFMKNKWQAFPLYINQSRILRRLNQVKKLG